MELTAARVGNPTRRQLLFDSREEPWSKAERLFHQLLRNAGITGWKANRPVVVDGSTLYVDIIFRKLKLVIEIDGRLYHTGTEVFEDHPEKVLAMVRDAIKLLTAAAL
jgi:very-short-patch-repair endonuclease